MQVFLSIPEAPKDLVDLPKVKVLNDYISIEILLLINSKGGSLNSIFGQISPPISFY